MEKPAFSPLLLAFAAVASVCSAPAAAAPAQPTAPVALSSASLAKSEAILGARSRLAEILAQQQGVSLPTAKPVQPASLRRPSRWTAIARSSDQVSPGVISGRPDVFGSVALSVNRTPLDSRWRKVQRSRLGGRSADFARSLRHLERVERIEAVNRYVNARVRFIDDSRQYGVADYWTAAADTLRRGRGDCEDYALAKLQMLRAAGFAERDLYLVVVKDLVRRADHAVLVVRTSDRMLMLDNGTDVVADTETISDYRPIMTFASNGTWTHGYRRGARPVTLAEARVEPVAPAAAK